MKVILSLGLLFALSSVALASPEYSPSQMKANAEPKTQHAVTITPQEYHAQKHKHRSIRHKRKPPAKTIRAGSTHARSARVEPVPSITKLLDVLEFGEFDGIPIELIESLPRNVLSSIIAARAKAYLVRVTTPGGTMIIYGRRILARQLLDSGMSPKHIAKAIKAKPAEVRRLGVEYSVGMLHDVFAIRLARAIKQGRSEGIKGLGVFSAFRDPTLRIGGFRDKAESTHAGGLAVDVTGVRDTATAAHWQRVANANGLYLPYGPNNRAERNHTQLLMIAGTSARPSLKSIIRKQLANVDRYALWKASGVSLDFVDPVRVVQLAYIGGARRYHAKRHYARHAKRPRYAVNNARKYASRY